QVKLTTRGGGVQQLILPKFAAANELGRPLFVEGKDGRQLARLELIPDDPVRPSFLFLHYRNPARDPDDKDEEAPAVPLTALGALVWNVKDEGINAHGKREVVMWTDRIDGYPDLTVRRVYTLGPKDYHIGHRVEILDTRKPGQGDASKPRAFRYQLTGAH